MSSLYYNISIEGTIGVGKTSLANLIAKKTNAKLILEKFEENPFLKDFYSNQQSLEMIQIEHCKRMMALGPILQMMLRIIMIK